jgi:CheY-like chemotaxis protein
MISATEWSDIEKMAKGVGVDGFIPKPLFPSSVVDCISEYAGMEEYIANDASACEGKGDTAIFEGRRILVAEDIEINREIFAAMLEPTGLDIDFAENGRAALEKFRQAPEAYGLIFKNRK